VKNVLDRSISVLLPFFVTRKDETHHKHRYKKEFKLSVYFYGDAISPSEMETAKKLVRANCVNLYVPQYNVRFYKSLEDLCQKEGIQ
ncbi:MAG: flavodoxin family protein, partial [Oscillospiraceae bacterium]|nr:flavodoxin family protein [Oscillospiraceae bacterium]